MIVNGARVHRAADAVSQRPAKADSSKFVPWPSDFFGYLSSLPGVKVIAPPKSVTIGGIRGTQFTVQTPPMHPIIWLKGDSAWIGGGPSGVDPAMTRRITLLNVKGKKLFLGFADTAANFKKHGRSSASSSARFGSGPDRSRPNRPGRCTAQRSRVDPRGHESGREDGRMVQPGGSTGTTVSPRKRSIASAVSSYASQSGMWPPGTVTHLEQVAELEPKRVDDGLWHDVSLGADDEQREHLDALQEGRRLGQLPYAATTPRSASSASASCDRRSRRDAR